ncbi:hypothetical protein RB195_003136 [Necator americanus]|uniref:Uncharacterized protein n=1 Tax=Necator americanus TaxID=51031 RepID=A0ABR1DM69_NECAM
MDLVDPATEEERACFGVIRPVRSSLSRTRRSKNISDTVDRVIAGCEEFVTQDEIMRGLDTAFEKLSVVPALRIPTESTKDDVHAERMDLGPIHAQRNEHI